MSFPWEFFASLLLLSRSTVREKKLVCTMWYANIFEGLFFWVVCSLFFNQSQNQFCVFLAPLGAIGHNFFVCVPRSVIIAFHTLLHTYKVIFVWKCCFRMHILRWQVNFILRTSKLQAHIFCNKVLSRVGHLLCGKNKSIYLFSRKPINLHSSTSTICALPSRDSI